MPFLTLIRESNQWITIPHPFFVHWLFLYVDSSMPVPQIQNSTFVAAIVLSVSLVNQPVIFCQESWCVSCTYPCLCLDLIAVLSTFTTCRLVYRINIHNHWKHFQTWQQLAAASGSILLMRCLPSHPTCRKKQSSWYCHL